MPTYQYKCDECNFEFEEFQKISEKPIKSCPRCGGKTRRIISGGAGFLLKGSGFYSTDYRSESYKKGAALEMPGKTFEKKSETSKSQSESSGRQVEKKLKE